MDSALAFAAGTAGLLSTLLCLLTAAVRHRRILRTRIHRPLRFLVGSTLIAAMVMGAMRPAPAVTPPPAVRIMDVAASDATRELETTTQATHVVERGDSLWRIARAVLSENGHTVTGREVAQFWPTIYAANRDVIGGDPNLIHPGQRLVIPAPEVIHGA